MNSELTHKKCIKNKHVVFLWWHSNNIINVGLIFLLRELNTVQYYLPLNIDSSDKNLIFDKSKINSSLCFKNDASSSFHSSIHAYTLTLKQHIRNSLKWISMDTKFLFSFDSAAVFFGAHIFPSLYSFFWNKLSTFLSGCLVRRVL